MTLSEKYACIRKALSDQNSNDPVQIAKDIMKREFVSVHGREHHFLDGAAFIVAYKNAGGDIDVTACLEELEKRASRMSGAMCGFWGFCGAAASVGAALSIIHGTGPLSDDEYYKNNMEYTSSVLAEMSKTGGPRCCKRHAFTALRLGADYVRSEYGLNMCVAPFVCEFSDLNQQCKKQDCPYYGKK